MTIWKLWNLPMHQLQQRANFRNDDAQRKPSHVVADGANSAGWGCDAWPICWCLLASGTRWRPAHISDARMTASMRRTKLGATQRFGHDVLLTMVRWPVCMARVYDTIGRVRCAIGAWGLAAQKNPLPSRGLQPAASRLIARVAGAARGAHSVLAHSACPPKQRWRRLAVAGGQWSSRPWR